MLSRLSSSIETLRQFTGIGDCLKCPMLVVAENFNPVAQIQLTTSTIDKTVFPCLLVFNYSEHKSINSKGLTKSLYKPAGEVRIIRNGLVQKVSCAD